MELWVIKNRSDYIRITDGRVTSVGLDKASVFPYDQLDQAKILQRTAREQGFAQAAIFRLTLTETPL